MPKYSARAAPALGYLKRSVNDVEIYVEDTSNRNMWVRLLSKIIKPGTRLRSINMLGGKQAVLDACAADQLDDGRRKLYIIDGDFEILQGKRKRSLKFLYRLRAYCVENILLSPRAATNIALEIDPNATEVRARLNFDYPDFLSSVAEKLRRLFALYAVANKLCPTVQTVAFSVSNLCTRAPSGELVLDDGLVRARENAMIRQMLNQVPKSNIRTELVAAQRRAEDLRGFRCVSGKDYLFPLFESRMRLRLGYKGSTEQLKVRLANHFTNSNEGFFCRRLSAL